jgi:hypothetical protein
MMNIVHANGQGAEGKFSRVGPQVNSRGRTRGELGRVFGHKGLRYAHLQVNKLVKRGQGGESNPLTADRIFCAVGRILVFKGAALHTNLFSTPKSEMAIRRESPPA